MRAVFLLLLFANLAFLAWAEWIDAPQPATANDVYAKLPRLKLVGETSGDATQGASGSARKTALQRAPQPPQCLSVGPFYDEAGATRGASLLHDKGLTPRQRSADGEIPKGFWVYIGGLQTDADVSEVLRLLQQSHVDDAHLVPDTAGAAADAHRVSVGIFSDRDRADRRAQSLRKLGLQPEVAERKVPAKVFWLDAEIPPGGAAPTAQDFAGSPDSQATVTPCPGGSGATSQPAATPVPAAPGSTPRTKIAGAGKVP